MNEIIKWTEDSVNRIDEWIKRNGYGLVAKCEEKEIALNCGVASCISGALIPFFGAKDYVLTALKYKMDKDEIVVADVYYSESESITAFALFLTEVE